MELESLSTSKSQPIHDPVMVAPILQHLSELVAEKTAQSVSAPQRETLQIFEGTVGEGGHSEAMLTLLGNSLPVKLTGCDRDPAIFEKACLRLAKFSDQFIIHNQNYSSAIEELAVKQEKFHFFLFDLGISSFHYEDGHRGFSFRTDEPLDMRLDPDSESAADLCNRMSEKDLADTIFLYGDEKKSRSIARRIVAARPLRTVDDLVRCVPRPDYKKNSIHPATRTFQALRIAVNREMDHLLIALANLPRIAAPGAVAVFISFHSIEDRLVKWLLKRWENPDVGWEENVQMYVEKSTLTHSRNILPISSIGSILTKKPLLPADAEVEKNPRARSAKLRSFRFFPIV